MDVNGDFYDIVTYLSSLFSRKKLREVEISGYGVTYISFRYRPLNDPTYKCTKDFPDDNQIDKTEEISLDVSGISKKPVRVKVSWDHYNFPPSLTSSQMNDFIASMDRSTFRYF